MEFLAGILSLVILCGVIMIFSPIPISLYQKKQSFGKNIQKKAIDHYRYLFDVYDEMTSYTKNREQISVLGSATGGVYYNLDHRIYEGENHSRNGCLQMVAYPLKCW